MAIQLVTSLLILSIALVSADLKNSDFETPPSNLPENSTSPIINLLNGNNTIPGWTFEGNVSYVNSDGDTISLPENGHGIQLGEDGKINQTFVADGEEFMDYLLTFTLASGGKNCIVNASLEVSAPDSIGVYSFKESYGKVGWQVYGHFLGSWEKGESVNLVIGSQKTDNETGTVCWPVIDQLLLKSVPKLELTDGNSLSNEGFEFGPEFPSNSSEGLLIDSATSPIQSPLLDWAVLGTVRYINSDHFYVPDGKTAVEIVSGVSGGIQTAVTITQKATCKLEFKLGDANNSCVGDFIVGAQAGSKAQNFTLRSEGKGSAKNFSMTFTAESATTTISFISYADTKTENGVLCGPVIDGLFLSGNSAPGSSGANKSVGMRTVMQFKFLVPVLFLALLW